MSDIWRGTTALVTGASRGMGAAFADLLAARGTHLILVARNAATLEPVAARARLAGVTATVLPADLGRPEAPAALASLVAARGLVVDHLVNNAGIGPHGRFVDSPLADNLATIDLNVRACTELAQRFLPGMIARRRGGVLNISSTAAFQGLAWLPVYSATKAYLLTWSEAVREGLRGTGVRCTCLCPGPVDTPFFDVNHLPVRPPKAAMQSAEDCARAGLRAYEKDKAYSISALSFRLTAWSVRLVPRAFAARLGAEFVRPGGAFNAR